MIIQLSELLKSCYLNSEQSRSLVWCLTPNTFSVNDSSFTHLQQRRSFIRVAYPQILTREIVDSKNGILKGSLSFPDEVSAMFTYGYGLVCVLSCWRAVFWVQNYTHLVQLIA